MEALNIKPTTNTLEVFLNAETGNIYFSGRSYPENSVVFFKPIIDWVEEYALSPAQKTVCSFKLEYFNSASRKCVVNILKILNSIRRKGSPVIIIWNFEEGDDNMKETGEEYANLFNLDFQFNTY